MKTDAPPGLIPGKEEQEDRILLAKNRDYLISHRELQVIFRCKPDKGDEYFSVNSMGACNVFSSGMNRKGWPLQTQGSPPSMRVRAFPGSR